MYDVEVKKNVLKFIESLPNSNHIKENLKELNKFKSDKKLHLDIKKLNGGTKNQEIFRLRIGEIRFIFEILKEENLIIIKLADYRGRVYN